MKICVEGSSSWGREEEEGPMTDPSSRSTVLGNKIEMEITSLVEQNPTLLRLGLHLEYNDARHRIAMHLQRNIDRSMQRQSLLTGGLEGTWGRKRHKYGRV
uniref:Uncharacterized protein n=1 Tax=Timema cristinae TaxID=61476 RepID=A0A7R9D9P6_TIMCR|nr:unnamed protein product [Timema cristinae]